MRKRVLYVDENDDTRALITRWLELEGFEVLTASTYARALDIAQRNRVHVLINDLGIRDGSLILLLTDVQKWQPSKGIALSWDDAWDATFEAGYSAHVLKPVELEKLSMAIADVLDGSLCSQDDPALESACAEAESAASEAAPVDVPDGYGWGGLLGPCVSAVGPPIFLSLS